MKSSKNFRIPKDLRKITWAELELDVQKRANKKDGDFILKGPWKKFISKDINFSIYSVDGEWIRNNLNAIFGHGGHALVYEFIPLNEIWIDSHHKKGCGCKRVRKDRKTSTSYFKSTTVHEIKEFKEMKRGAIYWKAHQIALRTERELGMLPDPFTENYQ
jgi:hypothetical protein